MCLLPVSPAPHAMSDTDAAVKVSEKLCFADACCVKSHGELVLTGLYRVFCRPILPPSRNGRRWVTS